jgi:hypothetical protein
MGPPKREGVHEPQFLRKGSEFDEENEQSEQHERKGNTAADGDRRELVEQQDGQLNQKLQVIKVVPLAPVFSNRKRLPRACQTQQAPCLALCP